jgi:site-specific DNA-methyltransferase (adenine-specific)
VRVATTARDAGGPLVQTLHCDALTALRAFHAQSVDIVVTDPAYESLEKHRARGTTTRLSHSKSSSNDWFKTFPNSDFPALCEQLYRVLRPDSHCYVMCDDETSDVLRPELVRAGFKVWKRLVWNKLKIGMGYHYRAQYEFILFAEKGKRKLADLGIPDVLDVERVWRGYPTEKPPELAQILIRQSAGPGDILCDPFMGSGAFGVAAVREGLGFIGCDVSVEAFNVATKRVFDEAGKPGGGRPAEPAWWR